MTLRLPLLAAVLALAAVPLAACGGGSGDEDDVKDTVSQFSTAFADGDEKKACSLLSKNAEAQLVKSASSLGGTSCEKALSIATGFLDQKTKDQLKDVEIESVKIEGDKATVVTKGALGGDDSPTKLVKEDGEWKVDTESQVRQ